MIIPEKVIIESIMTEKATEAASNQNQYTFKVAPDARSEDIKAAIEKHFEVTVVRVNTLNVKPRIKASRTRRGAVSRKSGYKKAIVHLKAGDSISMI